MDAKPTADDYRVLLRTEWADLHHSRIQEWTALGVVTGAHVGILKMVSLLREVDSPLPFTSLAVLGSIVAALFGAFGALMTCRHRNLMQVKLGWIYEAEEHLGLIKSSKNPKGVIPENAQMKVGRDWGRLSVPRFLSTSWLILCFFVLLIVIDAFALVMFGLTDGP